MYTLTLSGPASRYPHGVPPQELVETLRATPIDMSFLHTDNGLSAVACDLVANLLVVDPSKRLGTPSDASDTDGMAVALHDFFSGIDWARLDAKQLPPPLNVLHTIGKPDRLRPIRTAIDTVDGVGEANRVSVTPTAPQAELI